VKRPRFWFFLDILFNASQRMGAEYFQLPVAGKQEPIYRERDYCYELYHWMRQCTPGDFGYRLDGEADKSGHSIIEKYAGKVIPDFIIHNPGSMEQNLTVMEVKPVVGAKKGFIKDVNNLSKFLRPEINYYRAILLVYGDDAALLENIIVLVRSMLGDIPKGSFYLMWHKQGNIPVETIWINE
jgi:hypothetical protein